MIPKNEQLMHPVYNPWDKSRTQRLEKKDCRKGLHKQLHFANFLQTHTVVFSKPAKWFEGQSDFTGWLFSAT